MRWTKIKSGYSKIIVYKGLAPSIPMKGYAVVIKNEGNYKIKILKSEDSDSRETVSQLSKNNNAVVVINGGYFLRHLNPSRHVGLLKSSGKMIEEASPSVLRKNIQYFTNRGAIGITYDDEIDIGWCSTNSNNIYLWDSVLSNKPGYPADSLRYSNKEAWDVKSALHAGPILVQNGKINITSIEEVFFDTPIVGVHPRSAIGYRKNGDVVLMVIDGRQVESRGAYLEELALLMTQFDCVEALNLDGGGSSTLVVNNSLINSPLGLTSQREVMSAIAFVEDI